MGSISKDALTSITRTLTGRLKAAALVPCSQRTLRRTVSIAESEKLRLNGRNRGKKMAYQQLVKSKSEIHKHDDSLLHILTFVQG